MLQGQLADAELVVYQYQVPQALELIDANQHQLIVQHAAMTSHRVQHFHGKLQCISPLKELRNRRVFWELSSPKELISRGRITFDLS